jgi:PhzF family phenazine biosynthesis protein
MQHLPCILSYTCVTNTPPSLYRCTAFASRPDGGNPAGVWIGETLPDPDTMQQIAGGVGFSETAFVAPSTGTDRTIRYYSLEAEVSFYGHATIAAGRFLERPRGKVRTIWLWLSGTCR